jgi:hypothetical protein
MDNGKGFDLFELMVACLLGLGALGGAWASYQNSLWGGNQATAYAEAATIMTRSSAATTEAAAQLNLAVQNITRDSSLDIQAKQLILEGRLSGNEVTKLRTYGVAKYLYGLQMSDEGFAAMKFPPELRGENAQNLTDEQLEASLDVELGEDYLMRSLKDPQEAFVKAGAMVEEADTKFADGRKFNATGDQFGMTGVFYTVGLFLAGIALVFKSNIRWAFGGLGAATFAGATAHLFMHPWV